MCLISGVSFLAWLLISALVSVGLAILLVEKGGEWPVSMIARPLRRLLRFIGPKAEGMLECLVCTSFWTTLLVELCLFVISHHVYFLWPLSGFAVCGIAFMLVQIMNAMDRE